MKKKIKYISIIVLILGIIAIFLKFSNPDSTLSKNDSDFSVKDTASITKLFMADMDNNSVKIVKIKPGEWILNDTFPSRNDNINILLKTLRQVEVKEPVPLSHKDGINALLSSKSIKVEIYQRVYFINIFNKIKLFPYEKRTKVFYVGVSPTQNNMGTYMVMDKSATPYITHIPGFRGFLSSRFSCLENDWRIPRIFDYKLSEIKSLSVHFIENPDFSFRIENNHDRNFTLYATHEQERVVTHFDTLKVLSYMASFESINFESIINKYDKKDSIINSNPYHIITLNTFDGQVKKIKTYHRYAVRDSNWEVDEDNIYDKDRFYALINDEKDFVLIQFFVFDKILRPLPYFNQKDDYLNIY